MTKVPKFTIPSVNLLSGVNKRRIKQITQKQSHGHLDMSLSQMLLNTKLEGKTRTQKWWRGDRCCCSGRYKWLAVKDTSAADMHHTQLGRPAGRPLGYKQMPSNKYHGTSAESLMWLAALPPAAAAAAAVAARRITSSVQDRYGMTTTRWVQHWCTTPHYTTPHLHWTRTHTPRTHMRLRGPSRRLTTDRRRSLPT